LLENGKYHILYLFLFWQRKQNLSELI
jgi:hypothetical protein